MPWRGHAGKTCKRCERPVSECGSLSARYLCPDCGKTRMTNNLYSLVYHAGPFFDHWRARVAASVGANITDE